MKAVRWQLYGIGTSAAAAAAAATAAAQFSSSCALVDAPISRNDSQRSARWLGTVASPAEQTQRR